jgi:hypothetical protein
MTKNELKILAAQQNVQITAKGYKLYGKFYPIENFDALCALVERHCPLEQQIIGWLYEAVGRRKTPWPIGA